MQDSRTDEIQYAPLNFSPNEMCKQIKSKNISQDKLKIVGFPIISLVIIVFLTTVMQNYKIEALNTKGNGTSLKQTKSNSWIYSVYSGGC